jgi:hypothetical protein
MLTMTRSPRLRRGTLLGAALVCANLVNPFPAYAETPLDSFCADNAAELTRTNGEMGLDPAAWASNPYNLGQFGYDDAGYTDTLYQQVIGKGEPYIESYFSNLIERVEWRCSGQ